MSEISEQLSTDVELRRSQEYVNEVLYPTVYLQNQHAAWAHQQREAAKNPARQERITRILTRIGFELTMRREESGVDPATA